ncbi:MAG TPA: hypothetical protein VMP68_33010 [Candidatus Eisenbacteria bacterium]|nr:hypothetical protein [Candidatus Eisenbacteria bacterium]
MVTRGVTCIMGLLALTLPAPSFSQEVVFRPGVIMGEPSFDQNSGARSDRVAAVANATDRTADRDICYPNRGAFNPVACAAASSNGSNSFLVYRVDQVNSLFDESRNETAQQVRSEVASAEARITANMKASIDQIPQRLLSDAARDEIKAAVLAELKSQLDQLRADLQKQIDDLKAKQGGG